MLVVLTTILFYLSCGLSILTLIVSGDHKTRLFIAALACMILGSVLGLIASIVPLIWSFF